MIALLATHAFLWWVMEDMRLSTTAREFIADRANQLLVSAAVAWEISIKHGTGKLTLPEPPADFVLSRIRLNQFEELWITLRHALQVPMLPPHHRDPFDRIPVAQCIVEGLPIITVDPLIGQYDVRVIW